MRRFTRRLFAAFLTIVSVAARGHRRQGWRMGAERRTVLIGLAASTLGFWPARLQAAGNTSPDASGRLARPQPKPATGAARAILYEEDPSEPNGKRFAGDVRWSVDTPSTGSNATPETMVRAGVAIPERQLTLNWTLRRNQDRSLPASHTIDLKFAVAEDFSHGGIANVPGLLMKDSETARGTPLRGTSVKVTEAYFLVGLTAAEPDRGANIALLRGREWFDVPIVYRDNRRAILAFQKGAAGARAFDQAFAAWDGAPAPTDRK